MKFYDRTRRAMTAIELLAATMLASLMLASVTGLLGALAREERALRASTAAPHWHRQLADQLQWDLRNSREFVASPDGVRLVGFTGRDFGTGQPTGRPTEVEYYLVEAANDRWLVRRETHADEHSTDCRRTEVVCRGIGRLDWGSVVVDRPATNAGGLNLAKNAERTLLPEQTVVQLFGTGVGPPLFEKVFLVP